MNTETLQKPFQSPQSALGSKVSMPGFLASSFAIATLISPISSVDTPTYLSHAPSELSPLVNQVLDPVIANINLNKLIFSLRLYRTFEENWDGYGGTAPSDEAIENSIKFLKKLPKNIALPHIGLSGDGEISLFWDKNNTFIDIGFRGNNKYSYYARISDGTESFGDDIQISSELSPCLIRALKTIRA